MADILVRDVPDDVVAALDARARQAGLSRSELIRRTLLREATTAGRTVTVADLKRFAESASDLADPDVMRDAWS
jgi:hypothetical protein